LKEEGREGLNLPSILLHLTLVIIVHDIGFYFSLEKEPFEVAICF
jgi:hypothetical protein